MINTAFLACCDLNAFPCLYFQRGCSGSNGSTGVGWEDYSSHLSQGNGQRMEVSHVMSACHFC